MKKKLALLMAAIMTVAMVPATAFASTKLTAVDEITTAVDKEFESRVELKKSNDQVNISGSTFDVYAVLTNGKFTKDAKDNYTIDSVTEDVDGNVGHAGYVVTDPTTAGIVKVDVISDTKAKVTLNADVFNQNEEAWNIAYPDKDADGNFINPLPESCVLPIKAKAVETGDVTVTFTSNVTAFKTASEVIAKAVTGKVDVTVDGVRTFVEDSSTTSDTVKDITISELTPLALTGKDITLTLKGNWIFENDDAEITFLNEDGSVVAHTGLVAHTDYAEDSDGDDILTKLIVTFDEAHFTPNMLTKMTISGLTIETTKKCDAGDVATITVSSKDFDSAKLEVAKMVEEAVTYSVEDKDLPTIWAGKNYGTDADTNTLKLSIEENTGDILNTSRKATFTFPEGIEVYDIDVDGVTDDFKYTIDQNVVSIYNYSDGVESKKTDMTIKFILNAAPTFTGDVTATLGGQFDDTSFKVATVKAPYTVEAKTSEVLIDYRYVPVNDIVITEAEDGILDDDDQIVLAVEKMDFEDAGDVEVTEGDIDVDVDIDDAYEYATFDIDSKDSDYAYLVITVKDASTEASTMVISGLELYLDRTLPVGGYALNNVGAKNILWQNSSTDDDKYDYDFDSEAVGDLVSEGCGIFKYKAVTTNDEYVNVITAARDQDDSMTTKKIVITVGATTMAAGTETVTLDAPAYINSANYTMLPLRAISEAFGATVNWDDASKTVTILSGQRIISMTIGSKTMYINGTPVAMNTAPEVSAARTFVPVRDLANSLGISNINWTEASGTVTLN